MNDAAARVVTDRQTYTQPLAHARRGLINHKTTTPPQTQTTSTSPAQNYIYTSHTPVSIATESQHFIPSM